MQADFRFAHLSDPHLPLSPGPRPGLRALTGKRGLGLLSWRQRRSRIHRPEILAALIADVRARATDHVVVTGDLTNIALPDEFDRARQWLETVGSPDGVSLVPGNHDATVPVPRWQGIGQWQPWMSGDLGEGAGEDGFPYVRVRGPVAFIGVSTAVPSLPLLATGRIGEEQATRLQALLSEMRRRDLFRVVLIHHPPLLVDGSRRKGLSDRALVQRVLKTSGAELILHGHHHRTLMSSVGGPDGPIPVIGVASASAVPRRGRHAAQWIEFTVTRPAAGPWHLSATVRGYAAPGFHILGRFAIPYGVHDTPS